MLFRSLGRDLFACPAIDIEAVDIGHEDAGLTGRVGAGIPGGGFGIERAGRTFGDSSRGIG